AGPQFLAFYAMLFLAAVALAGVLRWSLRQPSDDPSPESLNLSPNEIAYLQGGELLAIDSAIARLVHEDALEVDSGNRKLKARGEELPGGASKLEAAVFAAVKGDEGETIAAVRSAASPLLAPIRKRLRNLGFLVADDRAGLARFLPTFLVLLVPVLGVMKISVGLERGRPVGFLVGFCIVSAVIALAVFGRAVHRSRRGDRVLAHLKQSNAALEYQASRRLENLSGD